MENNIQVKGKKIFVNGQQFGYITGTRDVNKRTGRATCTFAIMIGQFGQWSGRIDMKAYGYFDEVKKAAPFKVSEYLSNKAAE